MRYLQDATGVISTAAFILLLLAPSLISIFRGATSKNVLSAPRSVFELVGAYVLLALVATVGLSILYVIGTNSKTLPTDEKLSLIGFFAFIAIMILGNFFYKREESSLPQDDMDAHLSQIEADHIRRMERRFGQRD